MDLNATATTVFLTVLQVATVGAFGPFRAATTRRTRGGGSWPPGRGRRRRMSPPEGRSGRRSWPWRSGPSGPQQQQHDGDDAICDVELDGAALKLPGEVGAPE